MWGSDFEEEVEHVGLAHTIENLLHRFGVVCVEGTFDVVVKVVVLHETNAIERNHSVQLELLQSNIIIVN